MLLHALLRLRPQVDRIVINANGDPARFSGYCRPVVADSIEGYLPDRLPGCTLGIEWARRETPEAQYIASVPVDSPFPAARSRRLALKAELLAKDAPCAIAASKGAAPRRLPDGALSLPMRSPSNSSRMPACAAPLRRCARMRGRRLRSGGDR